MARWRSSVLVLVLAAGCAFTDGEPWGEVRPALRVVFDPSPERLTPEGWLRTTLGYGVELHALDVSVDGLTLSMAAGGEGAAVFDPADPPEGYSLCHNGHCHAASGALVSYEAIAAELGGGGTTEGFVLAVPAAGSVPAASGGGDVPLGDCPGDCALPRGRLAGAEVAVTELRLQLTVHDLLPPDQARLPPEGLGVEAVLELHVPADIVLDVSVGKGHRVAIPLEATLELGELLFDGVEWADRLPEDGRAVDLSADNDLRDQVTLNLVEGSMLVVMVRGREYAAEHDHEHEHEHE